MSVTTKAESADWARVGLPRWYDCKLARMTHRDLGGLTGISITRIRHPVWTVGRAIAPYRHLLGVYSDSAVGRLSGVSTGSVRTFRQSLGVPTPKKPEPAPRIPKDHPVKPFSALLGLIDDKTLARLAGVSTHNIRSLLEKLNVAAAPPAPKISTRRSHKDFQGPLLGYESLLGSMSDAKVSRATGVPFTVVQARRVFLRVAPYQRRSRLAPYEHLLGVVPGAVLAKLVGLSPARINDMRKSKEGKSL
ncbi:hypothetical protein ALQ01_200046 [Pseudomonas savastanoi pv. glycinea]|nr:hypothetical protein ALQ01_200046 [Pseudomonas savastanoi pv. glycinea]